MPEQSPIKDLEDAIVAFPQERRTRVLQRLTEAFIPIAGRLQDHHIDVFDQVICALIAQIETPALTELSLRLAPLARAPRRTVSTLARNHDFAVAGEILAQSEQLTCGELVDIATIATNRHLVAISGRKRLDPPVTEVLVRRANAEALRILAGNAGAAFSPVGYTGLIERAVDDPPAAEKVIQRADISPEHLQLMITRANELLRARLIGAAPAPPRAGVERLIAKLAEPPPPPDVGDDRYYVHTMARLKQEHGAVTEKEVAALANGKKAGEVTAALAIISDIPPETVEELMDQERLEPFLMMCKAANFRWPTVRSLLELRARPVRSMQDFLTAACDDFNRMSPMVSRQALKFWQTKRAAAG